MLRYRTWILLAVLAAFRVVAGEAATVPVTSIAVDDIRSGAVALPVSGFVSSGQPDADALQKIAGSGFVAVVDLRTDEEDRGIDEQYEVERLGMQYVSLPVDGDDGVTFENAAELDRILGEFDGPVLLHCGSGNRVGALFALRASLRGASIEEAVDEGLAAGMTRAQSMVEQKLREQWR